MGETVDTQGRRGFVLTLQAREQHIRREKATSNILHKSSLSCSCEFDCHSLVWGKEGIPKLALTNTQRAFYLRAAESPPGHKTGNAPTFNEFLVRFLHPASKAQQHFRKHQIEVGFSGRGALSHPFRVDFGRS